MLGKGGVRGNDFSVEQYYSQLSRYEKSLSSSKVSSSHGPTLNTYKSTYLQIKPGDRLPTSKLTIDSKLTKKTYEDRFKPTFKTPPTYQRDRSSGLLGWDKDRQNAITDHNEPNQQLDHSAINKLSIQNLRSDSHQLDARFTKQDQSIFIEKCANLYRLSGSTADIVKEVEKATANRDGVYEVIQEEFPSASPTELLERLDGFSQQLALMKGIVDEFQHLSKLKVADYYQLYYFLKTEEKII